MKGEVAGAVIQFSEAVHIRPMTSTAKQCSRRRAAASGRIPEAIPASEHRASKGDQTISTRITISECLSRAGRLRGALAHFRAAVRLNPQDARAEANLERVAETGNLKEGAIGHSNRALQKSIQERTGSRKIWSN